MCCRVLDSTLELVVGNAAAAANAQSMLLVTALAVWVDAAYA
jgi:hypothetical protein